MLCHNFVNYLLKYIIIFIIVLKTHEILNAMNVCVNMIMAHAAVIAYIYMIIII